LTLGEELKEELISLEREESGMEEEEKKEIPLVEVKVNYKLITS
jgi:hypothetical protein